MGRVEVAYYVHPMRPPSSPLAALIWRGGARGFAWCRGPLGARDERAGALRVAAAVRDSAALLRAHGREFLAIGLGLLLALCVMRIALFRVVRRSGTKERKDMIMKVWEQVKWDSGL